MKLNHFLCLCFFYDLSLLSFLSFGLGFSFFSCSWCYFLAFFPLTTFLLIGRPFDEDQLVVESQLGLVQGLGDGWQWLHGLGHGTGDGDGDEWQWLHGLGFGGGDGEEWQWLHGLGFGLEWHELECRECECHLFRWSLVLDWFASGALTESA